MNGRGALWWLSFVGGEPETCLGVAIVQARTGSAAIARAAQLGIRPDVEVTEVATARVPPHATREREPRFRNRLIPVDELRRELQAKPIREWEGN